MRLAVVSPFVDRRHGTERALAELLERLARNYACEIHLHSQRVEDLAITGARAVRDGNRGAIFWHRVPVFPGPPMIRFMAWVFLNRAARRWNSFFRGLTFDLILSPGINCFDADAVVVHVIFQRLHELSREEIGDLSGRPGLLRRIHRRLYYWLMSSLERRVYTRAQISLATVSKRAAGLLARYFQREGVCAISYGVDSEQFSPSRRLARRDEERSRRNFCNDELVLLLIGNAWHTKGLATVFSAMRALPGLPLQLMIVGSDEVEPFRKLAARLGILHRCHWLAPDEDVLKFYAAADIYVGPSLEDNFALPALEAMACGLPVITSVDNGGSQAITEGVDGFVLSDPRDGSALAQLLLRLYEHPDMRQRVGENAARTASAYTWDRNAAQTMEFLEAALKRKRAES